MFEDPLAAQDLDIVTVEDLITVEDLVTVEDPVTAEEFVTVDDPATAEDLVTIRDLMNAEDLPSPTQKTPYANSISIATCLIAGWGYSSYQKESRGRAAHSGSGPARPWSGAGANREM